MEKIIVLNKRKVSDFIGLNVNEKDDLLKNDNPKIKKFIKEYSQYFCSNKIEKIKEFYELTGLIINIVYNKNNKEKLNTIYTMNNIFRKDIYSDISSKPIYMAHILVINNYDDNNVNYFKGVYEKNRIEIKLNNEIRYNLSYICNDIKEKEIEIEKHFDKDAFKDIKKDMVRKIYLTPLNNLCILLNDGKLYVDKKLYAENVDTLWSKDYYNTYIIYKNNIVEELTSQFPSSDIISYKKVIHNEYMLACLFENKVSLTILPDEANTSIITTIIGVDDIECSDEVLYLIIDNRKILIPCCHNTIVINKDI